MTKISSATQQANFINSFCSKKLSDTELRLFNVEEGRVRLRDRIADLFSTKVVAQSELQMKYNAISRLVKTCSLSTAQYTTADDNLSRFNQIFAARIPFSIDGPVYEGL